MKTLQFKIHIQGTREKVWKTMLEDGTYRIWTREFNPNGSWYEGSFEEGSDIKFLGPDQEGKIGGMVSVIAKSIPYEYISIEHKGMIHEGVVDTTSEEVKRWAGAHENYTFIESNGGTDVLVELEMSEDDPMAQYMNGAWPRALSVLKELAEK